MLHGYPITPAPPLPSASASTDIPAVVSVATWDYPAAIHSPPASAILALSLTPIVADTEMALTAVVAPVTVTGDLTLSVDASALGDAAAFLRCEVMGVRALVTIEAPLDIRTTFSLKRSVDGGDAEAEPAFPLRHITVKCFYAIGNNESLLPQLPVAVRASLHDEERVLLADEAADAVFPRLQHTLAVHHTIYFDKGLLLKDEPMELYRTTYAFALRDAIPRLADAQVRLGLQEMVELQGRRYLKVVFVLYPRVDVPIDPEAVRDALPRITRSFLFLGVEHSGTSEVTSGFPVDGYCAYRCCSLCPGGSACTRDADCLSNTCSAYVCVARPSLETNVDKMMWYVMVVSIPLMTVVTFTKLYRKYRFSRRRGHRKDGPLLLPSELQTWTEDA
jgi:hypothetical protein